PDPLLACDAALRTRPGTQTGKAAGSRAPCVWVQVPPRSPPWNGMDLQMAQVTGFNRHKFEAARFDDCLDEARRILVHAADEWSKGNPEDPPTTEVLSEILEVFQTSQFLKRPYGGGRE